MEICELILSTIPRLEQFNAREYPPAFEAFEGAAAPFFAGIRAEEAGERAEALILELENLRSSLSRRKARDREEQEKMVLALFLAPAALRCGGPAEQFAEELSRLWNARYPRNCFYPGTYAMIMEGFEPKLFGIPLKKDFIKR